MKAERRHELQTNSLALWLRWRAPELWQEHGTKVLLVLIFAAAIVMFVRYRLNAPKQAANQAQERLAAANELLAAGSNAFMMRRPSDLKPAEIAAREAMTLSTDPDIQAEAYLTLGDYYWQLATMPIPPEAATQPSLAPDQPKDELIRRAQEAYTKAAGYASAPGYVAARAEFGLAAIEETQAFEQDRAAKFKTPPDQNQHWSAAKRHYELIRDNNNAPQALRDEAKMRLEQFSHLQEPVWFAPPSTQPATTRATTQVVPTGPAGPPTPEAK